MAEEYTSSAGYKYPLIKKAFGKKVVECPKCSKKFDPKKTSDKCPKCGRYI